MTAGHRSEILTSKKQVSFYFEMFEIIKYFLLNRLNRGHVTRKQFHQCLAKLNITIGEKELAMLEGKFMNNLGFNYVPFLNEIQPAVVDAPKYAEFRKELEELGSRKQGVYEPNPCNDIQSILVKIKDQVNSFSFFLRLFFKSKRKFNI